MNFAKVSKTEIVDDLSQQYWTKSTHIKHFFC